MTNLKLSTATNRMILMVDSTDHVTGKTGLTLTITASKNGAAFASITPTVTERTGGWYSLALTSSHTDTLGDLVIHCTGTNADPADRLFNVVPVNAEANVIQWKDTNVPTPNTAGYPVVDIEYVDGATATLQNMNIGV